MNSIIYIGMDVHKNTYNLCSLNNQTGEIFKEVRIPADISIVKKYVDNIRKEYEGYEIIAGYEAGCLGYSLYHQLINLGIQCNIMAPTTIKKSAKNVAVKNDKRDARNIAEVLSTKSYKAVYVPADEDVEVKEYIRMLSDFKEERKKLRQQVNALLLRHGLVYSGKSKWGPTHAKWLKELKTTPMLREILDEYIHHINSLNENIDRYTTRIDELSHQEKYDEPIKNLRCIKGIDTMSAMTLHIEISDFNRFPNANAFMSFCGLTPGENSSGDKGHRLAITKQGNSLVRTTLIESANSIVKGNINQKSKRLLGRQNGQDVKAIDYADKASYRLQMKFNKMIQRGVKRNIAITAVARELAGFIWGMETKAYV